MLNSEAGPVRGALGTHLPAWLDRVPYPFGHEPVQCPHMRLLLRELVEEQRLQLRRHGGSSLQHLLITLKAGLLTCLQGPEHHPIAKDVRRSHNDLGPGTPPPKVMGCPAFRLLDLGLELRGGLLMVFKDGG